VRDQIKTDKDDGRNAEEPRKKVLAHFDAGKCRKSAMDLAGLATQLDERKAALMAEASEEVV